MQFELQIYPEKFIFNSSFIFLHMAPFAKLTVQHLRNPCFGALVWSIISTKELHSDCKAQGNHKTVKQAPRKIQRHREQGFDAHHCWINENENSRNVYSMTGNFSTTYQVFISLSYNESQVAS